MNHEELLNALTARYKEILGDQFVGLYIHGSIAFGCYNPRKSDIDYIVVCEDEPDDKIKRSLMDATLAYMHRAPTKGLEMHLLRREDCLAFTHPARFLLHYSPAHTEAYLDDPHDFIDKMKGYDPDLAAHITILRNCGIVWAGAPIDEVFAPVPREAYIDSILADAGWSDGDAMYHVLNRCRILAYLKDNVVLSKRDGGAWALMHLSTGYKPVIRDALNCYESNREMKILPEAEVFCNETLCEIKRLAGG